MKGTERISAIDTPSENAIPLPLFSKALRILWVLCVIVTLVAEVIPMPLIRPSLFYSYKTFKAISFLCFGFVTPLAFWRFDSLGFGILVAVLMTMLIEAIQAPIMGHSFSWLELGAKVLIIFLGFLLGLNARYDQQISFGPLRVNLLPSRK